MVTSCGVRSVAGLITLMSCAVSLAALLLFILCLPYPLKCSNLWPRNTQRDVDMDHHNEVIGLNRTANRACSWVSHNALFRNYQNALFRNSQTHSVHYSIKDFYWVFLEIPVKNCIVGMLSTCPIRVTSKQTPWSEQRMECILCQCSQVTIKKLRCHPQ